LMATGAGAAAMDEQPADAVDGLMHILIADDDPVSRVYLRAAVERLGHRCTVAYDGAVAWELFLEERPDLLITDWQMPGLNGTELVRRVREQHDSAYVYALVLTGAADEDAARETMNAGADDLIYKPLYASELERKLIAGRRALELHRRLHHDARADVLTGIWNSEGEDISISIGVAALAGREIAAAELLAGADQALGRAKAKGRNRVEVADVGQASRSDGERLHTPHRSPVESE
jgi:PleD family two-component response regulator